MARRKDLTTLTVIVETRFEMSLWDCIKLRISGLYKAESFGKYLKTLKKFAKEMNKG